MFHVKSMVMRGEWGRRRRRAHANAGMAPDFGATSLYLLHVTCTPRSIRLAVSNPERRRRRRRRRLRRRRRRRRRVVTLQGHVDYPTGSRQRRVVGGTVRSRRTKHTTYQPARLVDHDNNDAGAGRDRDGEREARYIQSRTALETGKARNIRYRDSETMWRTSREKQGRLRTCHVLTAQMPLRLV